jgi:hypothetical protein
MAYAGKGDGSNASTYASASNFAEDIVHVMGGYFDRFTKRLSRSGCCRKR